MFELDRVFCKRLGRAQNDWRLERSVLSWKDAGVYRSWAADLDAKMRIAAGYGLAIEGAGDQDHAVNEEGLMNVHFLELFYYVAKHGGISPAVRKIPYGIQQPAVSGQILKLEEYLGVTLFQRRPFLLTPEGEELFKFIRPFFDDLDAMAEKLRGGRTLTMRVAASTVVLRVHFPEMLQKFRNKYRNLRLILREGLQPQMEDWLLQQEIDLAVTVLEGRPAASIKALALIELPLLLLVPRSSPRRSAEEYWSQARITDALISLPAEEPITKMFHDALARKEVEWPTAIEVSSLDLVETYVLRGFGVGLTVDVPQARWPAQVRRLPLTGFPPVVVGVLWRGKLSSVAEEFLADLQARARTLSKSLSSAAQISLRSRIHGTQAGPADFAAPAVPRRGKSIAGA